MAEESEETEAPASYRRYMERGLRLLVAAVIAWIFRQQLQGGSLVFLLLGLVFEPELAELLRSLSEWVNHA